MWRWCYFLQRKNSTLLNCGTLRSRVVRHPGSNASFLTNWKIGCIHDEEQIFSVKISRIRRSIDVIYTFESKNKDRGLFQIHVSIITTFEEIKNIWLNHSLEVVVINFGIVFRESNLREEVYFPENGKEIAGTVMLFIVNIKMKRLF